MFCFRVGKNQPISSRETIGQINFGHSHMGECGCPVHSSSYRQHSSLLTFISTRGLRLCQPDMPRIHKQERAEAPGFSCHSSNFSYIFKLTKLQKSCTIIFQERLIHSRSSILHKHFHPNSFILHSRKWNSIIFLGKQLQKLMDQVQYIDGNPKYLPESVSSGTQATKLIEGSTFT